MRLPVTSASGLIIVFIAQRYDLLGSSGFSDDGFVAGLIRGHGLRVTPARLRVLHVLRAAPRPLTHNEIEVLLGSPRMDRVTLYRVLDGLVSGDLAHRSADAHRVFRFSAAGEGAHALHVHFRCQSCGGVFCLDAIPPPVPRLPPGFFLSSADFDLHGWCAACSAKRK